IVIALDTPVTDHPVSRVMAPRNTGSENIAPIATQPSRPPAVRQSPSDTENWSLTPFCDVRTRKLVVITGQPSARLRGTVPCPTPFVRPDARANGGIRWPVLGR